MSEVGGRSKDFTQIAGLDNSYILADDIETPAGRKLPVWTEGSCIDIVLWRKSISYAAWLSSWPG